MAAPRGHAASTSFLLYLILPRLSTPRFRRNTQASMEGTWEAEQVRSQCGRQEIDGGAQGPCCLHFVLLVLDPLHDCHLHVFGHLQSETKLSITEKKTKHRDAVTISIVESMLNYCSPSCGLPPTSNAAAETGCPHAAVQAVSRTRVMLG